MLENAAGQQEEYYRKNVADLTKQHTEQLEAIFRRNQETENAFLVSGLVLYMHGYIKRKMG